MDSRINGSQRDCIKTFRFRLRPLPSVLHYLSLSTSFITGILFQYKERECQLALFLTSEPNLLALESVTLLFSSLPTECNSWTPRCLPPHYFRFNLNCSYRLLHPHQNLWLAPLSTKSLTKFWIRFWVWYITTPPGEYMMYYATFQPAV